MTKNEALDLILARINDMRMGEADSDLRSLAAFVGSLQEALQRCGDCGAFQSDPAGFSEQEQNEAELIHCGCKNPHDEE